MPLELPARPAVHPVAAAGKTYTPPDGEFSDSALSRLGLLFKSKETTPEGVAVVTEIAAAMKKDALVVVGMKQNPECSKVLEALKAAGFTSYTYLEYGSYFSMYSERLAIKKFSGWTLFPQVFVKGQLIGGLDLTKAAIASGELATLLK